MRFTATLHTFGRRTSGGHRRAPALRAMVLAAVLGAAAHAEAGPPLICHRFDIGTAASLPWSQGDGWDAALSSYDVSGLPADTLRLLAPETPVRVRMETLRRATIYAARDPRIASTLLSAVVGRVLNAEAGGKPDALAWFDAGYLVESYRQASQIYRWNMVTGSDRARWALKDEPQGLDGYAWVQRALTLSRDNAGMLYAASLMREGAARVAKVSGSH
jgi:hypothetical protein